MLVLEVTDGGRVYVGEDDFVQLIETRYGKARIGFAFDKSIRIERQSVRERRLKRPDEAAGEVC